MSNRRPSAGERREGHNALPRDVVRVMQWARANVAQPVRLELLARVAGVPARTLESHFERFLGTTPLAWVRQERLTRARQAFEADPTATVSEIAVREGFTQLGRFAAAYARRFGELPSETVRRIRDARPDVSEDVDDDAIRLSWRALPAAFEVAPDACRRALEELDEAQQLAPSYGLPKGIAAWCHGQRAAQHFGASPRQDTALAVQLAREACRAAPTDALVLTLASGALTLAHRLDEADALVARALALEPASPWAWIRRAWASAYAGDARRAYREFSTTLHLMPFEPVRHLAFIGMGCAYFLAGRYDRAARWARSGVDASPGSFWGARVVAAAASHAGARAEARRTVRELLRSDPGLTVSVARGAWPFPQVMMDRLADGLEAAGLPRD